MPRYLSSRAAFTTTKTEPQLCQRAPVTGSSTPAIENATAKKLMMSPSATSPAANHSLVAAKDRSHAHRHGDAGEEPALFHLLYHLWEDDRGMKALLAKDTSGAALRYFTEGVEELVDAVGIVEHVPHGATRVYAVHFVARSYVDAVDNWLSGGADESPERVYRSWWAMVAPAVT